MGRDELIAKMRNRVEKCRRLAQSSTDGPAIEALTRMAEEIEVDIGRLLAEGAPL